jgi:hypothetical protein
MPMPAFDMERGSTSLPDGNPAPPSGDEATAVVPPESAEATAAKPANGGTLPAKPPAASLISIAGKAKPASSKAGDLTRLFDLARRQGSSASVEPPSSSAPAPIAEVSSELEPGPESSPIEPVGFVERPMDLEPAFAASAEPDPTAEPLTLSHIVAEDVVADGTEHLPVAPAPADHGSASLEFSEPTPDVVEPAAIATPAVPMGLPAPLPAFSRAPEWASPPPPSAAAVPKFAELADYWRSLRSGDDHPAAEAIDHDLVSKRWPGSLLIAYTPASQDPRGEPRPGRVTRLGVACAETQKAVDAGSHSTEWMLEVARAALINDEPVEEQQRLATLTGDASFRMVALPLGPPKRLANAVLCRLLPSPGAPRFGKRRTWL